MFLLHVMLLSHAKTNQLFDLMRARRFPSCSACTATEQIRTRAQTNLRGPRLAAIASDRFCTGLARPSMLVLPDCTDSEFTDSWSRFALAPITQLSHIGLDCTMSAVLSALQIFFFSKSMRPELYILRVS